MPLPTPALAAQVPSHLPWQSTVTPPDASQEPEQLPLQLPVQSMDAPAMAEQLPMHETSRVPPMQVGGLAMTLQLPITLQCAWQSALTLTDAEQAGGSNATLRDTP